MKSINILSLTQAYDALDKKNYKEFLEHYHIEIRDKEVDDLKSLIHIFNKRNSKNVYSQFYVGYKIPQIGKEFDLLRFGKKCIINIELKSCSTEEKILNQLKRNKYYLCFLKKKTYNFTFVSNKNKLYYLNNDNNIIKVKFSSLIKLLHNQDLQNIENVNSLFDPSDYLVSPFNSPSRFIKNEYFLTHQQEEVKAKVISIIDNGSIPNFISITGSAGTGKTLLTYDIAKEVMDKNGKVLIIHCGQLNDGQEKLNTKYSWEVVAVKYYAHHSLSDYELIIIDEAQRIYPSQLDEIVKKIKSIKGNCIFSFDKSQTLAYKEDIRNIPKRVDKISSISSFKLSEKIRTNKEISSFIRVLFNKKNNIEVSNKGNVELNYFNHIDDAKDFLNVLRKQGWEVIRFTPSQYTSEHHEKYSLVGNETSHKVIGQEFDKVVVTIDEFFSYHKGGRLVYNGQSYYPPVKMLFQNITRTRKKLNVVIIGNSENLGKMLDCFERYIVSESIQL